MERRRRYEREMTISSCMHIRSVSAVDLTFYVPVTMSIPGCGLIIPLNIPFSVIVF